MRILVFRGGALGDFLVTLPALGLLRTRWPGARLELVGNVRAAELAPGLLLDAVHDQHAARWAPLCAQEPLPAELAAFLRAFDLVFNCWPDADGALAAHFARLGFGAGGARCFLSAPAQPQLAPAARHFCEPLRALGLETNDYRSRLGTGSGAGSSRPETVPDSNPGDGPSRPIAIHPGSGSPRKNWLAERWLELIARLNEPVLLVLGEAECERWSALVPMGPAPGRSKPRAGIHRAEAGGRPALHLAANLPLPDLAARLAQCRLFLGHDSGVSHLAAAVGTPCVLLFGPTDPMMWAPPGPKVQVLRRGAMLEAISVADLIAAIPPL